MLKKFYKFLNLQDSNDKTLNDNDLDASKSNTFSQINFNSFYEMSQKLGFESYKRLTQTNLTSQSIAFGLLNVSQQFATAALINNPVPLLENQIQLFQNQMQLLQNSLLSLVTEKFEPIVVPDKGDKRFIDDAWSKNVYFDYIKQSYLLYSTSILDSIEMTEGLDAKTQQRLLFFTRQWLNAIAPSNFILTNPEVLRATKANKGKNLIRGLKQLLEDLDKSAHLLSIRMTDNEAFMLGENIAVTPGKVVYRNRMFELIQYVPTTQTVNKKPLLIVPPWINKFYIMDLKEKNSYIRWALNEGHSVFVISWVNPDQSYKDAGMETYMHEGLLAALDVVEKITGEPNANVIGYCIGGMLLALTLSWLAENNQSQRIASATFWTTMFDFSDPGDLGVFIDNDIVNALEREGDKKGVFDGRLMGVAFSLLRENSLYWNYFIQNYLMGERPTPFDLLYWNSDCTNVTAALHKFVLRELYLGNKLIKKGELTFDNIKIDLSKVTTPTYVVAAIQDHIVKWKESYQSTQVFNSEVQFVLAESGHVAGIINPPTGKYGFYTSNENVSDPDEWFKLAEKQERSWWLHWGEWISKHSSGTVAARKPGVDNDGLPWPVLCDAPGEYVRIKAFEALA
ncbi:class I poly(R)-hydroxyalkanoic acid synthase [Psychrobacter sp.]|uniref:class I poly(R)-hydroxyalkanoic acid synthase n=1 Tax=Psychrobacter sp. TaxID=56811 RepID=UPI0025D87537|nr:class I poly(R)-hydroxyalkanoic acid synthase [Psychrobacter sp.]